MEFKAEVYPGDNLDEDYNIIKMRLLSVTMLFCSMLFVSRRCMKKCCKFFFGSRGLRPAFEENAELID